MNQLDTNEAKHFSLASILAIILIEGFVTVSVEILTIRQLAPVVGNSVVVTSFIIGVFLLFLAVGYSRGGYRVTDYRQILIKNFIKATLFIGIGLSYYFVIYFFHTLERYTVVNSLITLNIYLLLITAPIVYYLGQTVPIMTNLFRKELTVGAISGKVLSLSTLGSFLGAVLTSILLLNYLGVAWSVFFNCLCLIFLIVILIEPKGFWGLLISAIMICSTTVVLYGINVTFDKNYHILTNEYNNYKVDKNYILNGKTGKALIINESLSSFIDSNKEPAPYAKTILRLLYKDLNVKNKNILVLGAGGFTLSAKSTNGNQFTYVDVDEDILALVKKHYLKDINGEFIAEDARKYLIDNKKHFDVIISDVYNYRLSIPMHLLSYEYIKDIRAHLNQNGIAVFNMIMRPLLNDAYSKRLDNTVTKVFPNCLRMPLSVQQELSNVIYLCTMDKTEADKSIYRDNTNSATLDFFKSVQQSP